jgi:hypothetical protein
MVERESGNAQRFVVGVVTADGSCSVLRLRIFTRKSASLFLRQILVQFLRGKMKGCGLRKTLVLFYEGMFR